jgi:hypothetical protein
MKIAGYLATLVLLGPRFASATLLVRQETLEPDVEQSLEDINQNSNITLPRCAVSSPLDLSSLAA